MVVLFRPHVRQHSAEALHAAKICYAICGNESNKTTQTSVHSTATYISTLQYVSPILQYYLPKVSLLH